MKTSTLLKFCISFAVICFLGSFTGYINAPDGYENTAVHLQNHVNFLNSHNITIGYVIKQKDGSVAIYSKLKNNALKLYEEYDIPVSLLPEADRTALSDGIEVDSLSDAIIMVENFSGWENIYKPF